MSTKDKKSVEQEVSVEEKLLALYTLQTIDSKADEIRRLRGELPLEVQDLEDEIVGFNVPNILRRYEKYLNLNRDWILKEAPRRSDNKITEAVFHFSLVGFLETFLYRKANVYPEFPTGNGKVDILLRKNNLLYAIEIKSFTDVSGFKESVQQAAEYAMSLKIKSITLAVFVESINEDNRLKFEKDIIYKNTDVIVSTVFIATGN